MPTKSFDVTKRLQRAYEQAINRIARRVLAPKLPQQSLADWLHAIAEKAHAQDVRSAAEFVAGKMVQEVNVKNQRTWREAASKSQRTRMLYAAMQQELQGTVGLRLRQLRQQNAELITSVVPVAAQKLVREVMEAQLKGARPETIAKMARNRFPKLLRSRVNLIARTESQKTSAVLTRARAEHVGVRFYEWLTSEDQRVRTSHKEMNGVLVPYDDPPDPEALVGEKSSLGHYQSGECPNCRCSQAPLLDIDDVSWPHKVYWGGSIKHMRRDEFLKIVGTQQRAA